MNSWLQSMKQWTRWLMGEAPLPDGRSKAMLAGTVAALMPLFDLATYTTTVPRTGHWSNRQILVKEQQWLQVVFVGATAGIQVAAEAHVEDYEEAAFKEMFDL